MNNGHLSEERLQIAGLENELLSEAERLHLQHCDACRLQAASYKQLFAEVQSAPHAAFDFPLEEMVMAGLPETRKRRSLPSLAWIFIALATGAGLFWATKKYLLTLVTGVLPFTLYTSVLSALAIFVFLAADMYRRYQQIFRIVEQ